MSKNSNEIESITVDNFFRQNDSDMLIHDGSIYLNKLENLTSIAKFPFRVDVTAIVIIQEGEVEFSINLRDHVAKANDVVLIVPGDIIRLKKSVDLKAFAISIKPDYMQKMQIDFRYRSEFYIASRQFSIIPASQEDINALLPYRDIISDAMRLDDDLSKEIVMSLVKAFCYNISRLICIFEIQNGDAASQPRYQILFNKFMELLSKHHLEHHNVQFYASELCLTPNYLSCAIKQYSGKGALQWINEYVILEAIFMLHNSDISVKEIAYRLNFKTQSAFGKYFKQQTGMSPKRFRNNSE